jgi:hypothetical protein
MWDLDSYGDTLNEHGSEHHSVGSSLLMLAVVGVLLMIFA